MNVEQIRVLGSFLRDRNYLGHNRNLDYPKGYIVDQDKEYFPNHYLSHHTRNCSGGASSVVGVGRSLWLVYTDLNSCLVYTDLNSGLVYSLMVGGVGKFDLIEYLGFGNFVVGPMIDLSNEFEGLKIVGMYFVGIASF